MSECATFLHCEVLPKVLQSKKKKDPKARLPQSLFLKLSFCTNPSAPTAQLESFKNESFEQFPQEY